VGLLEGKVALITGAARGMGAQSARRYVEEGATVYIADVRDELGYELAKELGDAAHYVHLDVTNQDDWAEAVETITTEQHRLDVLVNNAGILFFAMLKDLKLEDFERMWRVNVQGCLLGMQAVRDIMTTQGGGSIINFSSIEGLASAPALTSYTTTKFAVRGMTKAVAMELGPDNIRVNSVHPGMINTQMLSDAVGGVEIDTSIPAQKVALRRVGQPNDVANMVVYLGSDMSAYSTGAEFVVDGGATATHAFNFA